MIKPEGIIHQLYTSFQIKDWKTMQSCYHDEAIFSDPVFQDLKGKEVKAMWHMLAASAQDLKVLFDQVSVLETQDPVAGKRGIHFHGLAGVFTIS